VIHINHTYIVEVLRMHLVPIDPHLEQGIRAGQVTVVEEIHVFTVSLTFILSCAQIRVVRSVPYNEFLRQAGLIPKLNSRN
jgi:hypothetical protein